MLWGKLFPVFDIFSHSLLYMEPCVGGILGSEEIGGGGVAEKNQFWLRAGAVSLTCFSLLLLSESYIKTCLKRPCPTAWLLKSLCSAPREIIWPCTPVNGCKEKKILTHPFQRLALSGDILQGWWPFLLSFLTASPSLFCFLTLVPHCFSFWFYKRTWHPNPDKMVTLRH